MSNEKKQISSIRKLGDYNTEDSKKLLIETLSTLNSFVRDEVVNSLVKIGDIDFLCENMLRILICLHKSYYFINNNCLNKMIIVSHSILCFT